MNKINIIWVLAIVLFANLLPAKGQNRTDETHNATDFKSEVADTPEELLLVRGDKLKSYLIIPNIAMSLRAQMPDTLTTYFYRRQSAEGRSLGLIYTGSLNSPWESTLFFDRMVERPQFAYKQVFDGMMRTPQLARFYNTRTPFTLLTYHRNWSVEEREETFKGTFGMNFGPRFNIGADFNYYRALGYYNSQASETMSYRFFTSYTGDKYEVYAHLGNDNIIVTENGGVTNDQYITNPEEFANGKKGIRPAEIPVKFPNKMLWNRVISGYAQLSQRFNVGYYKTAEIDSTRLNPRTKKLRGLYPEDPETVPDSLVFVPVASASHTFTYNKNFRRFISTNSSYDWNKVYPKHFIEQSKEGKSFIMPNDTAQLNEMTNTFALSLREGFKSWVKFGLSAYVRLENRSMAIIDKKEDNQLFYNSVKEFDTYVGGSIDRFSGKGLNFYANGELAVLGPNIGNFRVNGFIRTRFSFLKQNFGLSADGNLTNVKPGYFVRHHHGTFHWWDKDFTFERKLQLSARADWETLGTFFQVKSGTLQNYVYFGENAMPEQHSGIIQVLEGRVGHQFHWGPANWEIQGAYQVSSNQEVLPLPKFVGYANLFFNFYVAKVLQIQTGLEGYLHSAYYVPYYEPAVMQFINQKEKMIGGKTPLLNAYVNIHIKQIHAFLRMYNVGEYFIKPERFSALHYPIAPTNLQLGISVDFNK